MPDSLTKFKQDAPKAAAKTAPGVTVTDSSGNALDPATIDYPTFFKYRDTSNNTITNWSMTVNFPYGDGTSNIYVDGSLSNSSIWTLLYKRCELDVDSTDANIDNDVLPEGLYINSSNCKVSGVPTKITSSTLTATLGQHIPYKFKLYFKNVKGLTGTVGAVTCDATECYIKSDVTGIGVYRAPEGLSLTQNDRIGLLLGSFVTEITKFTIFDGDSSTRSDIITSKRASMASTQIVDSTKNIAYVLRAIPLTVASTNGFVVGEYAGTYDTFVMASTAAFTVGDSVSTNAPGNYTGIVASKTGTNTLRILRDSSSGTSLGTQLNGINITSSTLEASPIFGQIMSVNTTTNVVKVTQSPDYPGTFGVGSVITPYGQNYSTTVTAIDSTDSIIAGDLIDNDDQYYSQEAKVTESTQYYSVGVPIDPIKPNIGTNEKLYPSNGITYTIYPALPTGLTFCQTTATSGCGAYGSGYIIGTFNSELEPTTFNVTATNPIGSTSYSFKLAAIYKPKHLSYTKNQIIKVTNSSTNPTSVFYEGENIYAPIVAPAAESVKGTIKRKFKDTSVSAYESFLEVFNHNGIFETGKSLDSGRKYIAEKAFISATSTNYNFNLAIYVASTTNFNVGDIISNNRTPVAYGRIVYKNASRNTLYLQFLTPNTSSVGTFFQADTITDATTAATTTISAIESDKYRLTLGNFAVDIATDGFTTGNDITTTDASTVVSGYIYNYDDTNNYVYVDQASRTPSASNNTTNVIITHYPEFKRAQTAVPNEKSAASAVTVDDVTHDNYFVATRFQNFYMQPNVSQGTNLSYSIDSALPAGLSLDPLTGKITGKPTYLTPRKTYTVTVSNLLGKSEFTFDLEVRDYFLIAEESTSTSYVLHKYGDTQNTRDCKINATDIINSTGNLDVRCFLDAEEQDLYQIGLKFRSFVGAGVCEYVQYSPFAFQQYPARTKSDSSTVGSFTVNYVSGCTQNTDLTYPDFLPGTCSNVAFTTKQTCIGGGATWTDGFVTAQPSIGDATYCPANYTGWFDSKAPNCDEDSFLVNTITSSINTTTGACEKSSESPTLTKCGGNKYSCIAGAIVDTFTPEEIKLGYKGKIYEAANGLGAGGDFVAPEFKHKGGIDRNYYTNLGLANGTINNQTTGTNTDISAWMSYIGTLTDAARAGATRTTRNNALGNNPFVLGTPEYVFNCLDAAYDVKARIRVIVRDWDRAYKINDNIDQETPGTCSNRAFRTSTSCTGAGGTWTTRMNNAANNFYEDWDDDYYGTGASSYATGTCSNAAYNNQFVNCIVNGGTWSSPAVQYAFPRDWL